MITMMKYVPLLYDPPLGLDEDDWLFLSLHLLRLKQREGCHKAKKKYVWFRLPESNQTYPKSLPLP